MDIDGDDAALGESGCEAEGVVAGAGADIGEDGIGWEIDGGEHFGGGFLLFAVAAFEPVDGLVAHDVGDFPAHEELADAIGGGGLEGVVGRGGDGCGGCCGR